MNTAIIILNWNGKHHTIPCIASLLPSPEAEIVVVDNGSGDGSVEAISQAYPTVTIIQTGQNLGYAGGNNAGIEYALSKGYEFICILNNDTIAKHNFINNFLFEAKKHPDICIFGGWPTLVQKPDVLDHLGGIWDIDSCSFRLIGHQASSDQFSHMGYLDYVCGCSLLIRSNLFRSIGLFDPAYFLFWEEADFCMRAQKQGFQLRIARTATLLHHGSASFTGGKPHTTYFWWRNRLRWMNTHLSRNEFQKAFIRRILPEIGRIGKQFLLKQIQICIALALRNDVSKKKIESRKHKAALNGFWDYLCGKTGKGPPWLYTEKPPI